MSSDYRTGDLMDRVTKYITSGGRPQYQNATERPKTLTVYNQPNEKNNTGLGTFEYYVNDDGSYTKGGITSSYSDPIERVGAQIDKTVNIQAPQVKIEDNKVIIESTSDMANSPIIDQIDEELQSLKGADLEAQETKDAVNALNEEIRNTLKNWSIQGTLGWSSDEFANYQRLLETVRQANPMSSGELFKAKKPDGDFWYDNETGVTMEKTPKEWIDYWKELYSADERNELYQKSLQSTDPYERVMGLIMSAGGAVDKDLGYPKAVYGYDVGDYLGKFWETAGDNMQLFPMGIQRLIEVGANETKMFNELDMMGTDIDAAAESLKPVTEVTDNGLKMPWTESEEAFNEMYDKLKSVPTKDLSDAEKIFVTEVSVASTAGDSLGSDGSLYEKVKRLNDKFWKVYSIDKKAKEMESKHASDSIWASGNVAAGTFAGTVARFAWESLAGEALTGMSMSGISDAIGNKTVNWLASKGISPMSKTGQGVLKFTANLLGSIPEDIVQTAVDNVVTNNSEQNQYLFDPAQMGENFKQNLLFMAAWNAFTAGVSGVRKIKFLRVMHKLESMGEEVDFPASTIEKTVTAASDAAKVIADGGSIEVDPENGKVYAVDAHGNRTVMENITVEEAQMLNKSMADAEASGKSATPGATSSITTDLADATLPTKTVAELEAARNSEIDKLNQLKAQKTAWVENDYKDENGVDVRQRAQTEYSNEEIYGTSKLERLESEIAKTERRIEETNLEINRAEELSAEGKDKTKYDEAAEKAREASAKGSDDTSTVKGDASEGESVKTNEGESTKVSTEDSSAEASRKVGQDGETLDYTVRGVDDAIAPDIKVDPTPSSLRRWHTRALNAIMRELRGALTEFHARFGDVRATDFDWIWYNTRKHVPISEIVGSVDPSTGRVITQNMIDAAKWWGEQSFTKKLRMASLKALGKGIEDQNTLGYLPHTSYDPSTLTLEEAIHKGRGTLWQRATGKSVLKDGKYVGYGGTLEGRYRTFASNMLWDIRGKEWAAAKLIEEAAMDGKKLSPDEAVKMAENIEKFDDSVANTKSGKNLKKGALADGDDGKEFFKKAGEEIQKDGKKSKAGKKVHDIYGEAYIGSNKQEVKSQPKRLGSVNLDTQGETMRKISTTDGNMYENGGADLVYAPQNAFELTERLFVLDTSEWRKTITEFVMDHSRRSRKYAEMVADNILARMGKSAKDGKITRSAMIQSLSGSLKSEAWSRYRRWLARAKYDQFNSKTAEFIDDFTFRHMQKDAYVNDASIVDKVSNVLMELRYDSLFYGNLKNALLQLSELSRLFTSFKYRDVGGMLHRLATDADFRAKVDMYVKAVAPETSTVKALVYDDYGDAADAMVVGENGVSFKKMARDGKQTLDNIALAPIQTAEAIKNRAMIAALVQEADRLEAEGKIKGSNEKLMWIRQRFERVALANNEMGRIGLASNPVAKPFLFLQNFQLRELGMHYYNIADPYDLDNGGKLDANGTSKSKLRWDAAKYLMKVFGTKLGTTLLLSRLGYSAAQTLGLDPFGFTENYNNNLTEDERTIIDDQISNGLLTPFVSGGIMSLFADMYFLARESAEKANRTTISDDAEATLNKGVFGPLDFTAVFNLDNLLDTGKGFIPGYTAFNRVEQMNEMMNSGWATSATGNKMYTAPDDPVNTLLGYLFGRSATQNALNYNQTYGKDLGQTLNRTLGKFLSNAFLGGYNQLDAIDQQNYSDWFDGSENDTQQFEKGRRYFQQERDRILDAYEDSLRRGYGSDDEEAEAKNNMNERLEELYEKVGRFVDAYEKQHGTITGKMVKELINLLNQERKSINDTTQEANDSGRDEYNKALERYVQLGLPNVGTYTGPSKRNPDAEVKYQGSPQWRVKSGSKYDLRTEAVAVLDAGDAVLKDLRKQYKDEISAAYDAKDYDAVRDVQKKYLEEFDSVVGPILATYGSGILSSGEVVDKLGEMLSTDSGENLDFVPRNDWTQGTNNRYLATSKYPNVGVNLKKWLKERYSDSVYSTPTIRSGTTGEADIDNIKRLVANGQEDMARALALSLKVRIDNQKRSLGKSDYQWLLNFLNNGGQ